MIGQNHCHVTIMDMRSLMKRANYLLKYFVTESNWENRKLNSSAFFPILYDDFQNLFKAKYNFWKA